MALPADRIQGKIHRGYKVAAGRLGQPIEIYRPTSPTDPLRLIDFAGSALAVFDSSPNFKFSNPAKANVPVRFALIDGALVQSGDYLVGSGATHFVADMPALQPIVCVLCNTTLRLMRPTPTSGFGSTEPPGTMQDVELFRGWPASVLGARRGGADDAEVPGDVSPSGYDALMPPAEDVLVAPRSGDVVLDAAGRRFAVDGLDTTALGWRLLIRLLVVA